MTAHSNDDTKPVRLIWLPCVALGALCALLVWPQTHRLVAVQLRLAVPTPQSVTAASPAGFTDTAVSDYACPILRERVGEHADNLMEQIAAATNLAPEKGERSSNPEVPIGQLDCRIKIARLRSLIPRFEDQPSLYANILRFASQVPVRITREEKAGFLPDSEPNVSEAARLAIGHSQTADVLPFNTECTAGERLDPENGYFPMMHAIGYFEAHNDTEAIDAIERAGQCTQWNEYLDDEYNGEISLQEQAFGTPGSLTRSAFAAALLLPHLAQIRGAVKVALYEAVLNEQAGRISEGLRIRTAVRHIGSLMRSESKNLIGSLVGISLVKMSLMRPAGSPAAPKADVFTQTDAREALLHDFDTYLVDAGHSADIESVHNEMDASVKAKHIMSSGIGTSAWDSDLNSVTATSIVDMIVLSTILWLGAIGCLVCVIMAVSGSKPIKRLPRAVRVTLVTTLTIIAGSALMALLVHQANGSIEPITRFSQMWTSSEDGKPSGHRGLQIISDGYLGIIAVVPAMMLITLTALCLTWRAPVVAGVARGIRGCTIPLCSILMIGYVVLAPITAAYENRLDSRLTQALGHEGRATARMIGTEWPGIVR